MSLVMSGKTLKLVPDTFDHLQTSHKSVKTDSVVCHVPKQSHDKDDLKKRKKTVSCSM